MTPAMRFRPESPATLPGMQRELLWWIYALVMVGKRDGWISFIKKKVKNKVRRA